MNHPSPLRRRDLVLAILAAAALPVVVGASLLFGRQGPTAPETRPEEPPAVADPTPPAPANLPVHLAAATRRDDGDGKPGPFQTVSAPAGFDVQESFDKAEVGGLPEGWSRWSNGGTASFAASAAKALSAPNALAASGGSSAVARAWLDRAAPADVQASAAVYLDTLIPAQVLVRGGGLDTASPSYYAASVARGVEVQLLRVAKGTATLLGTVKSTGYVSEKWARLTVRAEGKELRVRLVRLDTGLYLNGTGQWQAAPAWALTASDEEIAGPGQVGLARPARYAGTAFFDDFAAGRPAAEDAAPPAAPAAAAPAPAPRAAAAVKPSAPPAAAPAPPAPWQRPDLPRHYPHIRIALLAYAGNPMGSFEDGLLRESVDLVVPNAAYLKHIHEVAPKTPQLVYTNTSNLYEDLLTDWLAYADEHGVSREGAFFHAARPVPFRGDSPSSRPVTWFWGVSRGGRAVKDLTSSAHGKGGRVPFGGAGESLYVGHVERFREINLDLASPPGGGWAAALEYPSAAGDDGAPAGWRPLTALADTTGRLTRSGQVTFDPPADWKPASVGGSARLFYVRFRTTADGRPPAAGTILGRDFVGAKGGTAGTAPVFDAAADANHDGYLDDAEYAKRAAGKDARFLHESRVFTDGYGQMRYSTHPSDAGFQAWCVDYHTRLLRRQPLAGGLFMDNSSGKVPVKAADVLEPVTTYSQDLGAAVHGIAQAIAPRPVLANTVGGFANAEPVIRQSPAYFEEFAIRPLSHPWSFFEDLASMVARRSTLTAPPPYAVLDSHPQKGDPLDPRLQLGTLAYYYLLADPDSTFLMFYGGYEPNTPWRRHWVPAAAYDVGRPAGAWSVFATGEDPAKPALTYKVYRRPYEKALVLFKPLSYARGSKETPSTGDETATRHDLGGNYRPLRADGSLGEPVTSVSLRNGEGAILVKTE